MSLGLLLGLSVLGQGGRSSVSLFVVQTVVTGLALIALLSCPRVVLDHRRLLFAVGTFSVFAWCRSLDRYSTMLVLADIACATLIYLLAGLAVRHPVGRRWVLRGVVGAAALNVAIAGFQAVSAGAVRGAFPNLNHGATLAAAGCALLLAGASTVPRALRLTLAAVLGAYPILIGSRGGTLAVVIGCFVALMLSRRIGRMRLVSVLGFLTVLAVALPTPLGNRVRDGATSDIYAYDRVQIWQASARMAGDHLWRGGVGLGRFADAALPYRIPYDGGLGRYGKVIDSGHSEYLHLLAEASVPGLLLLLAPLIVAWIRGRRGAYPASLAGLAAIASHAAVDTVLHSPSVLYCFAALVALAAVPVESEPRSAPPGLRPVAGLVLLALWAGGSLLPWQADRAYGRFSSHGDERQLDRAIALVPGHAGYHLAAANLAGERFLSDGDLAQYAVAEQAFARAVSCDPHAQTLRSWATFEARALTARLPSTEVADRAIGHLRQAVAADPRNAGMRLELVVLLATVGRADEAVRAAAAVVDLEPNFFGAYEAMLRAARQAGDRQAAVLAAGEMVRIDGLRRAERPGSEYERQILGVP